MINSAPHQEEGSIPIELDFEKTENLLLDVETIKSNLKKFIIDCYNN